MDTTRKPVRLRFSVFELDVGARELRKNGRRVNLQQQPFQALAALLERPGTVVSREELRHRIWPADTFVDFDTSLNVAIRRLRQALGDDADTPRFIQTLPRQGYCFIAPVVAVTDGEVADPTGVRPVGPSEKRDQTQASVQVGFSSRTYLVFGSAALLLLVLGLGYVAREQVRSSSPRQTRGRSVDPEVSRLYSIGRYEGNIWTREDLNQSVRYFEQAVQKDPKYAPAWAGLADSTLLLAELGFSSHESIDSKAKMAALTAIQLDDSLAASHSAMGHWLTHVAWSWTAAEAELRRAIAADPRYATGHQMYGYYLITQGRLEEAVREMRLARILDPLASNKQNSLAAAYYYARRYDEALAIWQQATAVDANAGRRHLRLAFMYEQKGMMSQSMAELLAFLRSTNQAEIADEVERSYRRQGFAAGKRAFFRRDLAAFTGNARANSDATFRAALDYVALGDHENALLCLDQAVAKRATGAVYLGVEPQLDPLRSDPRFLVLLRTIGLPSK